MTAYVPSTRIVVAGAAGLLTLILLSGFVVSRIRLAHRGRLAAWAVAIAAVSAAAWLTTNEPPGFRMIVIVLSLLYAMKGMAAVEACARGAAPLSFIAWICFAAGWFGMRPSPFHELGGPRLPGSTPLIRASTVRMIAGAILAIGSRMVWRSSLAVGNERWLRLLVTVSLMVGLSLIVHFGLFNVVAGIWRALGVDVKPLFRAPLASKTLAEFWSRRWNIGFSEMTSLAVYHPLRRKMRPPLAVMISFAFSGVLHEIAISLPVASGYGLPLVYFLIQGASMLAQRRIGPSRLWTLATLILPLPLLFHPAFLNGVVWPLI
jgi:membrane bound O-acyltransferase family protein